jgi:putative nucleotidyltransferase with HDIG domain
MKDIKKIIRGIAKLKPIPQVVNKILAIANDPEKGMAELGEVISYDPMATANLLKAANSSYYGCAAKFDSVQQAIVFLGMDEVVDLVLMGTSANNLERPQKGYGLKSGELWRYSVASALMARDLAEKNNVADKHLVFTAALLKDIGKVVLEQYVADEYEEIQRRMNEEQLSFREAEKAVLGIDHAELGALTAQVWQFSDKMIDVIRHHHQPDQAILAKSETAVVYLSDVLCMMMGISNGSDGLAYRFRPDTVRQLGMSEMDLQVAIAGFADKLQQVEEFIASSKGVNDRRSGGKTHVV